MGTMTSADEVRVGRSMRRTIERILTAATICLGVLLLTFQNVFQAELYSPLRIFPEDLWGAWWLALGVTRLVILWVNGFHPLSPWLRYGLSGVTAATVWAPLTGCFIVLALVSPMHLYLPGVCGFPALLAIELQVSHVMMIWVRTRQRGL